MAAISSAGLHLVGDIRTLVAPEHASLYRDGAAAAHGGHVAGGALQHLAKPPVFRTLIAQPGTRGTDRAGVFGRTTFSASALMRRQEGSAKHGEKVGKEGKGAGLEEFLGGGADSADGQSIPILTALSFGAQSDDRSRQDQKLLSVVSGTDFGDGIASKRANLPTLFADAPRSTDTPQIVVTGVTKTPLQGIALLAMPHRGSKLELISQRVVTAPQGGARFRMQPLTAPNDARLASLTARFLTRGFVGGKPASDTLTGIAQIEPKLITPVAGGYFPFAAIRTPGEKSILLGSRTRMLTSALQ